MNKSSSEGAVVKTGALLKPSVCLTSSCLGTRRSGPCARAGEEKPEEEEEEHLDQVEHERSRSQDRGLSEALRVPHLVVPGPQRGSPLCPRRGRETRGGRRGAH